jgi:Zn ribbon nucleic-acid-binding protein
MGSVIDYIECPNCDKEAFSDFYYKSGEEYVNCNNCGYRRSAELKRDSDGELVTKDGTERYDFDNVIMEYHELVNPYCAYRLKMIGEIGTTCGACETEEGLNSIKEAVDKMEGVEFFSYSRLTDRGILETILINNIKENAYTRDV